MVKKVKKAFYCKNCGNEFAAWSGQCSACGEWNTIAEISLTSESSQIGMVASKNIETKKLPEITVERSFRFSTGIGEFDRVLGGGIVPASLILIGGEPGIGKSTLLLQTCNNIANCLYVSAEESLDQIKDRASRLGINSSGISLISSGDLELIEGEILRLKPDLVIIDSIQTVYLNIVAGTAGSLVQVRECGIFLQRLAKSSGIPIVIVGHVTKDGSLAGPRTLEHLVDVVLYFEGDRYHEARILRSIKNRFGPTNEAGIFSIQDKGLVEVKNPSEIFLAEYTNNPGSVITVTLEGTRPILVEVQALVVPTHFGYPKRTSSGYDLNRLNLLSAVISKSTKVNLSSADIYLNIVGGVRISEPAADLAVCAAIISSFQNRTLPNKTVLFGEIGLSGEVRSVTRKKERLAEIKNLGYNYLEDIKKIGDLITKN